MSVKITTDTFGNQNRDGPAFRAVSQSYAPPRATNLVVYITKKYVPQALFSRSAKVCRFSFSPSEFNACNKLPKTRVANPEEITSLMLKPSAGHQPYPVPITSHCHNHFHSKCNQNISLPIFYVAHVVCIFLRSIFLITNKMHLIKYNKIEKKISYQVPAPTHFGIKVPSSGSFSATNVRRYTTYTVYPDRTKRTIQLVGSYIDVYVCVHNYECVAEEVLLLQQCGRVLVDVYSEI
jgi:hypothetical protein